ncbi:MAG: cytochrome c [Acidobacteria bacterium]|nr:cytochrome c [Acidobacteriota bacterium]
MKKLVSYATLMVVVLSVPVLFAQTVTTPEGLDAAMKKIGAGIGATQKAIASNAFADAKGQLPALRQAFVDSENFWTEKKKADAVAFTKDTIAKIDALDRALGAGTPDSAAVTAAFKEVGGSCRGCHMTYRAQENGAFIIKPGMVD